VGILGGVAYVINCTRESPVRGRGFGDVVEKDFGAQGRGGWLCIYACKSSLLSSPATSAFRDTSADLAWGGGLSVPPRAERRSGFTSVGRTPERALIGDGAVVACTLMLIQLHLLQWRGGLLSVMGGSGRRALC
jgi:hypothetical protein